MSDVRTAIQKPCPADTPFIGRSAVQWRRAGVTGLRTCDVCSRRQGRVTCHPDERMWGRRLSAGFRNHGRSISYRVGCRTGKFGFEFEDAPSRRRRPISNSRPVLRAIVFYGLTPRRRKPFRRSDAGGRNRKLGKMLSGSITPETYFSLFKFLTMAKSKFDNSSSLSGTKVPACAANNSANSPADDTSLESSLIRLSQTSC